MRAPPPRSPRLASDALITEPFPVLLDRDDSDVGFTPMTYPVRTI